MRLKVGLVLEWIMPLRVGHRPRVEPGIDDLGHAMHRALAAAALPGVAVDERLVRIEVLGQRLPPPLRQLFERPDDFAVIGVAIALPHVEGRAPVAVARDRPVDVVGEPLAEAAGADLGRMPRHRRVGLEHALLERRGAHEPRQAGVIDQRRVTAPAERIAVGVGPGFEPPTLVFQPVDDDRIGGLVGDQFSFQLRPRRALEGAVRGHRVHEREPMLLRGGVVVRAEGRRHVDQPRPFLGRDEFSRDDDAVAPFRGQRHDVERPPVLLSHQLASVERADQLSGREQRPAHVNVPGARHGGDVAQLADFVLAVVQIGMDRDRDIREQGPRRRGPHHEVAPRVIAQRQGQEDRVGLHLLIAEGELVRGERRAAARAVRQHFVAAVQQTAVVQPPQQPPH